MLLIEDAYGSLDEDGGDEETSSTTASTAAANAAAAAIDGAMSAKRQLQFMQLWGERRQQLARTADEPKQQQQQKQPPMPVIVEDDKKLTEQLINSRMFIPSSAWRGLPETQQLPSNYSTQPSGSQLANQSDANQKDYDDDDENDDADDSASDMSSEEDSSKDKQEADCLARADQIISDESAVSVQSLCEVAAAAAATALTSGRDEASNGQTTKSSTAAPGTTLREPAEIAALLQNIRLGRRELYAEDSYAVRLERDIRAELRTELERQQRLDARLDSLSIGDETEAVTTTPAEGCPQPNVSTTASVPVQSQQPNQTTSQQESVLNSVGVAASSLAMRIKRRIGGGTGVGGARDSGEPAPAQQQEEARLDRVAAKKSLQASTEAAARKKKKKIAAAPLLRRRDIGSSSSSNSTSDSSSSDSDPHVNNRCLWRKSRVSNSNLSNSNSSNAAGSDSGSSRSSQLDTGELDNNQLAAEESNSSLPARRPVFRAQDKVAPSKKPDSTALPAISGRGTKLNVSEFEADPNQSVHLGHVYQSVEQLEPSGAVRILDPRQMLADLDGGWPTDQLQSAPSNCEVSSDSVAFKPEVSSATASSRLHKSIQFSTSATAQPKSSSTTYSPQSNYRQPRHQLAQCDQKNPERREEALAKPRNTSADPAKLHDKRDERGRTRSQLMQQSDKKWIDIELPGILDRPKVLKKSELPVDEVAKRIVAHRLSRSSYLDSSQSGRTDARSPALNKTKRENKDFDESSTNSSMDSDDLDFQRRRFTSGHHGRISVTNFKAPNTLTSLSRPGTLATPSQPSSQAHQLPQQKDAKRSPTDSDWHNRNSSNRARRLNQHRQLEVTELKLAMHSTEPHFYSDSREPCTGVCGASFVPVSRRCRQAVLVQSQAVHSDLQLRRVQVNPRARRKKSLPPVGKRQTQAPGDQSSDLSNNNSSSGGASDRGDARGNHQKILASCPTGSEYYKGLVSMLQQDKHLLIRKKMARPIKTHCSQRREEPATIGHWLRLGSLPEPQKPAVAKVKRVHHADSNLCRCSRRWQNSLRRRPTEQHIVNLNCLNWNVSHCTETVENPSLMSVSDTEQQLTQSRQTALLSSWIEADRNDVTSTVTANSISCGRCDCSSTAGCLSTFDAATLGSRSSFDLKFEPTFKSFEQLSTDQLALPPVHEAENISYPGYFYCTSSIVENSVNEPETLSLTKRASNLKFGYSHLVYYMPNVTVCKRGSAPASSLKWQSHKQRKLKLADSGDSAALFVACELLIPTKIQQF